MSPVTTLSDRARRLPAEPAGRLDAAETAVASLERERERLCRLGLAPAIERCESERRYWTFVRAIVRIAQPEPSLVIPEAPWVARGR